MDENPVQTVPVAVMVDCAPRDSKDFDNNGLKLLMGEHRPFVVHLATGSQGFRWTDPLTERSLKDLLWMKGDLARNDAQEWANSAAYVEYVRNLLLQEFTRQLQARWPHQTFDEHWVQAVRLVRYGSSNLASSPFVKRVFDGFFPNAKIVSQDGKVIFRPVPTAPGDGSWNDIMIEELELAPRAYHLLVRAGVTTVGLLLTKSEGDLRAIPNFGKQSIVDVVAALSERGLSLRDEDD